MKGVRVAALLTGVTAALTLTACGVPPSGVIQAGGPATGLFSPAPGQPAPPTPAAVSLYFLHNGALAPYPRKIGDPGNIGTAVNVLFDGPDASESVTATTDLPRLTTAPEVRVNGDNSVVIQVPELVAPISHLAMRQLECTVAGALGASVTTRSEPDTTGARKAPPGAELTSRGQANLLVVGDGWKVKQSDESCPGLPQP